MKLSVIQLIQVQQEGMSQRTKSASEQDRFKEYVTMVIESEFKLTLFQEQKT